MKERNNNVLLITNYLEDINEAITLINTLGYNVIKYFRIRKRPDNNFYVGKGKVNEFRKLISELDIRRIYIYDHVKPRQIINLMKELKVEVLDKIQLILEIFALHAGSTEAKLQIEMAKIKHELPLIREWLRRAKLKELPGFLGPGAYAIDAYYTMMRKRLAVLKNKLKEIRERREKERQKRKKLGFPHISISGYTNAGKTTLFNTLVNENKPISDEPFTTLSPKAKAITLNGRKVVFIDTVGFIKNVPIEVIEAFYATLEEIVYSDLNLLVIDGSEDLNTINSKLISSMNILRTIGFMGKPILIVLNKVDKIKDDIEIKISEVRKISKSLYSKVVEVIPTSALKKININLLKEYISDTLA